MAADPRRYPPMLATDHARTPQSRAAELFAQLPGREEVLAGLFAADPRIRARVA